MKKWVLLLALILSVQTVLAENKLLKPFVLSSLNPASIQEGVAKAKQGLVRAGFTVVGEYEPKAHTHIIVVTSDALKKIAALSQNGGFGAAERVAVVKHNGRVEVSYTNPVYWWNAYRMKGDIQPVQAAMAKALGRVTTFGAEPGLTAKRLRKYHYKFMMPFFTDVDLLEEYDSHQKGIDIIEKNLAKRVDGSGKVYRIDIPGTEMVVWGVSFSDTTASDKYVLDSIDNMPHSHAAHLPYELLLNGKKAVALNGKFRIALSWPSLSMGDFMNMMSTPDDILTILEDIANPLGPAGREKDEEVDF